MSILKKKIFVLIPDGIGLRNFSFTSFVDKGREQGWEIIFWHSTPFDLSSKGFHEIKLRGKPRAKTDLLKRAKITSELNLFTEKFKDPVYHSYKFPPSNKGLKNRVKNLIVYLLAQSHRSGKGVNKLREKLKISERNSHYYANCLEDLKQEKPDLIFCSNQRAVNALAPLLAAEDLDIPTISFIFSWDNLPKATMVIDSNFYFVWSEYMKSEMKKYYPHINDQQIKITGSPQFEHHFIEKLKISREEFFKIHSLDPNKQYICFSGDDITTSPHDQVYLKDIAAAVQKLNSEGESLGIIFRRSPVDFSERFDEVLELYQNVISPIEPAWEQQGLRWNTVLPTKEDLQLQTNIIQHTLMVVNVGSSMAFDYACHNKPAAYINYNPDNVILKRDIKEIYEYIHFRSMPSKDSVLWINSKDSIASILMKAIENDVANTLENLYEWFNVVHRNPPNVVTSRLWEEMDKLIR